MEPAAFEGPLCLPWNLASAEPLPETTRHLFNHLEPNPMPGTKWEQYSFLQLGWADSFWGAQGNDWKYTPFRRLDASGELGEGRGGGGEEEAASGGNQDCNLKGHTPSFENKRG